MALPEVAGIGEFVIKTATDVLIVTGAFLVLSMLNAASIPDTETIVNTVFMPD